MRKLSIILLAFLFISSCEIVVDLDIPPHESLLVVNSVINSSKDSLFAYVSYSQGSFDIGSVAYLNDAVVNIYEDNVFLGAMSYQSIPQNFNEFDMSIDTLYKYFLAYSPRAESMYSLQVSHPNYPDIEAQTYLPKAVPFSIDTVLVLEENMEYGSNIRLQLSFEDLEEENFYRLRVFARKNNYYYYSEIETSDASMFSNEGPVQSGGSTFYGRDALFDDQLFNGEQKTITLDSFVYSDFSSDYSLELSSISKEYFLYLRSIDLYNNNNNFSIISGEPIQVYSNIENGLGIMGSISYNSEDINY